MSIRLDDMIIVQNFVRCASALFCSTFHVALEVVRAMFSREMDIALAHLFLACNGSVPPYQPARIAARQIGIAGRITERGRAGIQQITPAYAATSLFLHLFNGNIKIAVRERGSSRFLAGYRRLFICCYCILSSNRRMGWVNNYASKAT